MLKGCVVHRFSWVNNKMDFQMMISHEICCSSLKRIIHLECEIFMGKYKHGFPNDGKP